MHRLAISRRGLRGLGLALAVTNVVLWYAPPWLRETFDSLTGRQAFPRNPLILNGVQELFVNYDPWLARVVFPAVYTLGFVVIAFLYGPTTESLPSGKNAGYATMALLLLAFEAVWCLLIAFAIVFRGPDWNLMFPWDGWKVRIVSPTWLSFSDLFSRYLLGRPLPESPWFVREAPGLILAAAYAFLGLLAAHTLSRGKGGMLAFWGFVLLLVMLLTPLTLHKTLTAVWGSFEQTISLLPLAVVLVTASYLLVRHFRKAKQGSVARRVAYWRCAIVVFLVQLAALVPAKVILYWLYGLKYFIYVPEYSWNV
jgi:hypothetical protein